MESVGSHHTRSNHYDMEDLRRPLVANAEISPSGGIAPQRIRMSAIADLKEFTGRDTDEDRARSWVSKVKSAFLRDQAPDAEKCLVFGDLLTGPARNWYSQLSRSTRRSWKPLLESFTIQYCGYGLSVGAILPCEQKIGRNPVGILIPFERGSDPSEYCYSGRNISRPPRTCGTFYRDA